MTQDYFNIGIEKGREEGIAIGNKQRDRQIMEAMQRLGYTEKQISALIGAVN